MPEEWSSSLECAYRCVDTRYRVARPRRGSRPVDLLNEHTLANIFREVLSIRPATRRRATPATPASTANDFIEQSNPTSNAPNRSNGVCSIAKSRERGRDRETIRVSVGIKDNLELSGKLAGISQLDLYFRGESRDSLGGIRNRRSIHAQTENRDPADRTLVAQRQALRNIPETSARVFS